MKIRKRILKITGIVLLTIVLLLVAVAFAIRRPVVQTWLVKQTTNYLSNKLHTKVYVGSVDITFFRTVVLNDVCVLDRKQDTILSAQHLNISIGLFKLMSRQFSINSVSLSNITFNMLRLKNEKDFNFQFIIDGLASKDTAKSKSPPPDLNIKQINLANIRFHLRDEPSTDLKINLPDGEIDLNKLDLKNPTFDIKSLIFNRPDVRVIALLDTAHYPARLNDTAVLHLNRKKLQLLVNKLRLNNAHFKFDDESEIPDTTKFDTYHMEYSNINLFINGGKFIGDSIVGEIAQISCKEKSGLVVDTLYAKHARVTPRISEMTGLYIRTPNSMLKDYFSFNYKRFPDFNNLLTRVILDGDFKNSLVSLKDIGIFAPQLRGNKQLVTFTGKIIGTVDNLRGKHLLLNAGNQTYFKGDAFFRGLPNVDETYLELSINESRTNYSDLKTLLPAVYFPDNIATLGAINASGTFSGFFNDFVAYGIISSNIGVIESDLNMKLPSHAPAEYSGSLSTSGFNVGRFVGVDSLMGKLTMISKIKGSGLSIKDVSADLLGHIDAFEFNHYTYSNLSVDGLFDKKLFTGKLLVFDPNVHLDFQGTVNFNDSLPHFNFYATLDSANLKTLNFSRREFILSSQLNINLTGKKIDELYGNARADGIVFSEKKNVFRMDSLTLNVANSGKDKTFSIHSDILSLLFKGEFHLVTLPQSSIALIGHYFPSLPMEHKMPDEKQDFDYSLKVFNVRPFIDFFFPRYNGISDSYLNGHFNSLQNSLTINGEIPQFGVKNMLGKGIIVSIETDSKQLNVNLSSGYLQLNDSLKVLNPYFSTVVVNDTATINIKASDVTSKYKLDVTTKVIGKNDFVSIKFLPSKLILNNDSWSFTPNNELLYKNGILTATNLNLIERDQTLSLTNLPTSDNTTDLRIGMTNVHFEDFYNLIHFSSYSASGTVNGNIDLLNVFKALRFDAHASIGNFHFNGDSVNKINANINYNTKGDEMNVNIELKDKLYDIEASGNYLPRNNTDSIDFKLNVVTADLAILNKYLSDYVTKISGKTFGKLSLTGSLLKPQLNGVLTVDSAKTRVNYLQTTYSFTGAQIQFKDNLIDLGEFTLYDKDRNRATASGEITHDHLTNFLLNIQLNTDKFLLLNTLQKDNPLFYGTAYAGGSVKFTGPINNLDISATLQSKKGTQVSIPISDAQSVTQANFIRFINTPDSTKNKAKFSNISNSNLSLNLDLDVTPDALVKIIFNQRAGDIISGNGNGNLRLEINTAGKFNMYGDYTIEKGSYLFTLQNLLSKKFIIENGSTISYSGDPYQARIDINAIYTVSRASIADLGLQGLSPSDLRDAQRKVPVDLYMNLTGSLLSPSIAFDIKIPDNTGGLSGYATTAIAELKQDEGELNKQVFGLLMLNRFLPLSTAVDPTSVVGSSSISSLGEFIGNQLSYWLSQNKYNIDVNVSQAVYGGGSLTSSSYDPSQGDIQRSELQLALTKRFFSNRVSVDVGGNFNLYDNTQSTATVTKQQSNVYLGDFTVEYQITPNGQLALKGFYQSNYDIIDERNLDKWGGGIVFKKEFDRFKDLFKRDKTKKPKVVETNGPVPGK